jgi:hypothetical protein
VHREMTMVSEPKRPRSFSSDVPLVNKPAKSHVHDDTAAPDHNMHSLPLPLGVPGHTRDSGGEERIGRAGSNYEISK